jgi:hypothetical protein
MISANANAVVNVINAAIIHEISTPQPFPSLFATILRFLKKIPMPTTLLTNKVMELNKPILAVLFLRFISGCLFINAIIISLIVFYEKACLN